MPIVDTMDHTTIINQRTPWKKTRWNWNHARVWVKVILMLKSIKDPQRTYLKNESEVWDILSTRVSWFALYSGDRTLYGASQVSWSDCGLVFTPWVIEEYFFIGKLRTLSTFSSKIWDNFAGTPQLIPCHLSSERSLGLPILPVMYDFGFWPKLPKWALGDIQYMRRY